MGTHTVRVRLQDSSPIELQNVAVVIRIVDTTMADAPSSVIRQRRFRDLHYSSEQPWLVVAEFRLVARPARRIWTVEVLVDVDGDGVPSVGDFVNKQSFPLVRNGPTDIVAKRIHRIRV